MRGSDVVQRVGGLLVVVGGARARSVPVLARYRGPLLEAAAFAGERPIVGGRDPGRRNITDELCRALSSDAGLPRLEPGRLRSTWLVACADAIGLRAFMQAAGVRCSQRPKVDLLVDHELRRDVLDQADPSGDDPLLLSDPFVDQGNDHRHA